MGKYESKIPEIREKIINEIHPEKIILFGSYAWGTPTEDSDVDIFVVKDTQEPRFDRQLDLQRKLWESGVPTDILVYTPEEIDKRLEIDDPFMMRILQKGKIIYQS